MIHIIDNAFPNIVEYLKLVREMEFKSYEFGDFWWHGIGLMPLEGLVPDFIRSTFGLAPDLTFIRKSPLGQIEPNFIHTDVDMGDWTGLLYLNDTPDDGDGTNFWTHKVTGQIGSFVPHQYSDEGRPSDFSDRWVLRQHVASKFNRLVLFPSHYFHSRAKYENCGSGEAARLVQVTFGKGDLVAAVGRAT